MDQLSPITKFSVFVKCSLQYEYLGKIEKISFRLGLFLKLNYFKSNIQ